jgi:hypothetical protein
VCKNDFALYQKDGPGKIFRLYLDRLADTDGGRPFKNLGKTAISQLECVTCEATIASPMVYEKDDHPRTALRLVEAGVNQSVVARNTIDTIPDINLLDTMRSIIKEQT